jgi:glycosyltransferase involved in cell wall biosynthesis
MAMINRKELGQQLEAIGSADILVGIPSFNNARTIGHVVKAVQAGLAKYFPEHKSVLVNSDGGSSDGTMNVVNQAVIEDLHPLLVRHRVEPFHKIAMPYAGIPGKGSAFRAIFELADHFGARACAVVDSDLRSITPEWMELLLKPVLNEGFDFVAPQYHRHKYDGTITNSIIYPLTRALYGKRLRQPIGGDFGFSGRLARFYLGKDVWKTDIARYGIDIWMTSEALANGYRTAQAFLGAKIHDAKDPGSDLRAMIVQVVGSAFSLMAEYYDLWKRVRGSESVPQFGFQYTVGLENVNVDVGRMLAVFRNGVRELGAVWQSILSRGDLDALAALAGLPDREFRFPLGLWTRIIYDYALAYRKMTLSREHLLKSLVPLYLGKTAAFILEVAEMGQDEAEAEIEKLCLEFEKDKTYLVSNWR